MKDPNSTNSQGSPHSTAPQDTGFSPWQRLKTKRISYLTLPLLVMATLTEFVILATGWKYQQMVCLPQGMGVTFFGIGPIGATILAVELLKLPLAIWTASRHGWQKGFMLIVGLPLICVLTFQLVKDMAVYEMGTAMAPASQMLEKASTEEIKIAKLRARREAELARATKWNAEEARIENAYKAKLADYTNRKTAYLKDKAEYDKANFIKRKFMSEPVDPGVPPEREVNTILKPTLVAEIEEQIKAKEAELVAINNKRRERVAQVDTDARRVREEFDHRSTTKREESDGKREDLSAAMAALATAEKAERELIDQEFAAVVQKGDGIRAEIDACRKTAEGFYEARETAIRKTQVHRIATTVEIVRGLIKGERPMSIKTTAKERGD